jgi:hypothetical protein
MGTPAHNSNWRHGRRVLIVTAMVVAVAVLAVGLVFFLRPHNPNAQATDQPKVVPLAVVGTNPGANAANVAPSTTITVSLSAPLATDSPQPSFSPPIAGTWSNLSSTELQFVSSGPLVPGSSETLTIPGGPTGLKSTEGQYLASTTSVPFSVAPGSILRLQQLLAQLGYLPLSFTPATQPTSPQQEADPQQGTFSWRITDTPFTSLWTPGQLDVITKGAIMDFENQHNLTTDGEPGPQVWTDLLQAASTGTTDPDSYNFVYVSEASPETVTVYQNGNPVYQTLANTGVAAAPTAQGTFPVYARYTTTTMSGTNPDGSTYVDPGIPWVSYFNGGDALHGYDRPGYGYPQSDGCVEMPPANAQVVFPYTPLGTLVTVGN